MRQQEASRFQGPPALSQLNYRGTRPIHKDDSRDQSAGLTLRPADAAADGVFDPCGPASEPSRPSIRRQSKLVIPGRTPGESSPIEGSHWAFGTILGPGGRSGWN